MKKKIAIIGAGGHGKVIGEIASLNVSVSAGVILYEAVRQRMG